MTKRYLQVLVEVPADVMVEEAKAYIRSELKSGGGCRRIDDPLFSGLVVMSMTSVRVPGAEPLGRHLQRVCPKTGRWIDRNSA